MQAVTVVPGTAGSAKLDDVPEPAADLGSVLVEALAVGVCGTDAEIASGSYGWAPPGEEQLILGHESLGRVLDPEPTGLTVGDHVVGIVRRPDPMPCPNCAVGEWDMCSNGRYTERGIKQVHGFMAERWRIETGVRGPGRPAPRGLGCPAGAHDRRHQGVAADPRHWPAHLLGPPDRGGRWGGPDRAAGRPDRGASGQGGP